MHTELCYSSGFDLISMFVLPGFVFIKVDLLRQLITVFWMFPSNIWGDLKIPLQTV